MRADFRPWRSYADLSVLAAMITAALSICLLLAPGVIHWLFSIASEPATDLMSRRAGALFLGFAVITFQVRHAPQDQVRRAVSMGIAVMMGLLAFMGVFEYLRGQVGFGIWFAIVTEVFFSVLYCRFLFGSS